MFRILSLVLALLFSVSAQALPASTEPGLIHVVLVWLKEPGNDAHRQKIVEGSKALQAIPQVLDLRAGAVIKNNRPVAEDSFDVGLYFRFENKEALQAYRAHPIHVDTVNQVFKPLMKRFQVMDFLEE